MRILIAEDDRLSRTFLEEFMKGYGTCDSAEDGMTTLDYFLDSLKNNEPYDLLCLDIMMPKVDGLKVLNVIRGLEKTASGAGGSAFEGYHDDGDCGYGIRGSRLPAGV